MWEVHRIALAEGREPFADSRSLREPLCLFCSFFSVFSSIQHFVWPDPSCAMTLPLIISSSRFCTLLSHGAI